MRSPRRRVTVRSTSNLLRGSIQDGSTVSEGQDSTTVLLYQIMLLVDTAGWAYPPSVVLQPTIVNQPLWHAPLQSKTTHPHTCSGEPRDASLETSRSAVTHFHSARTIGLAANGGNCSIASSRNFTPKKKRFLLGAYPRSVKCKLTSGPFRSHCYLISIMRQIAFV